MKQYLSLILFVALLLVCMYDCSREYTSHEAASGSNKIELLSPEGLHKDPAHSQVAIVEGNYRTVYIGGQNAMDEEGYVVGKDNIEAQARQVLRNLKIALQAGGAAFENVVKWDVYLVQGQSAEKALRVFQNSMSKMKHPPVIREMYVAALANPDFLLEMDAVAVVPVK